MNFKKAYQSCEGYTCLSGPGNSSLNMLQFGILELPEDKTFAFDTAETEAAFLILGGTCDFICGETKWSKVGVRRTVFEGKAAAAYFPRREKVEITAVTRVKIAVIQSPIGEDTQPFLVNPCDVKTVILGQPTWMRDTHFVIDDRVPSRRLYVGEAFMYPGNWAGFPPHKHDVDDMPAEAVLEEIYYYLFEPSQGFAIQRLYTADGSIDEVYVVKSDEAVEFPRGYHPVVNAPGYNGYFLWAMAGNHRGFYRRSDPEHEWVSALENYLKKNGA
ncbi:MAG: 5-deoxy-glucuronate isomerase [Spirochaetes bacterium]|nr:5-deoxy-glucuronate isomerase [Spirochaetota bacterium]